MERDHRVVVGVDGSDGGRRALEWAAREVAEHGGTVQAVTAWDWDPADPGTDADDATLRAQAEDTLAHEVRAVRTRHGSLVIAAEAVQGGPAEVLTAAARDADLLVLGSHGHSRVWHTVLGSVSEACVSRATCPVVVVPAGQSAPARATEPAVPG
ncbi:MAG TPA: universal stress protein [Pilimelia sp.]|nr:universal stress protein [Pilimelia sp.]